MERLLFPDPIPRQLFELSPPRRGRFLEGIVQLFAERKSSAPRRAARRLSDRVCLYEPKSLDPELAIAFAIVRDQIVILQIFRTGNPNATELESVVDVLKHLHTASIGLLFEPEAGQLSAEGLERSLLYYCRAHTPYERFELQGTDSSPQGASANRTSLADLVDEFLQRFRSAASHTWSSSEARQNFKEVLDSAERAPQLIERGSQRFMVVEESKVPTLVGRKNAVQHYRYFAEGSEPMESIPLIKGRRPSPLVPLGN
jgi:hypothetical protein